jgi:hypothetical protein
LRLYAKNSSKQHSTVIRAIGAKIRHFLLQYETICHHHRYWPGKTGVIVRVTTFLFEQRANIEGLDDFALDWTPRQRSEGPRASRGRRSCTSAAHTSFCFT